MKKLWKRVRAFVADNWRIGLLAAVGLGFVLFVLTFQLGDLVGGASDSENAIRQAVATHTVTPETMLRDPLFLPYTIMLYILQIVGLHSLTAIRAIGVVFGLLGTLGFYYVLRKWYTVRIAFLGTALFVSSSWFLHTARFADPASTFLLLPLLTAAIVGLQSKTRSPRILLAVVVMGFLLLYVPGLVWFLLPAIILQRKLILKSLWLQPAWFIVLLAVATVLMLAPLAAMLVWPADGATPFHNALLLLGLPTDFATFSAFFKTAAHVVAGIFVYNSSGPLYTAGHLPWLDACSGVLAIMGMYQFARHFRLDRTKMMGIVGIIGLVLIATGGPVSVALLLPFVYLLVVEGLRWLLDTWLGVFPRNPVARGFGVGIVVVLVCMIGAYQLQKYFLAWGHAPETHAVFNKQL